MQGGSNENRTSPRFAATSTVVDKHAASTGTKRRNWQPANFGSELPQVKTVHTKKQTMSWLNMNQYIVNPNSTA